MTTNQAPTCPVKWNRQRGTLRQWLCDNQQAVETYRKARREYLASKKKEA